MNFIIMPKIPYTHIVEVKSHYNMICKPISLIWINSLYIAFLIDCKIYFIK